MQEASVRNNKERSMWTSLEPWQIAQLDRLSTTDHDLVESALNCLWDAQPELLEQIAVGAVDQGDVTIERAAQVLGISAQAVEQKLADFRRQALKRCCLVVCGPEQSRMGSVAKLADG